jgi:hypothetical protein
MACKHTNRGVLGFRAKRVRRARPDHGRNATRRRGSDRAALLVSPLAQLAGIRIQS